VEDAPLISKLLGDACLSSQAAGDGLVGSKTTLTRGSNYKERTPVARERTLATFCGKSDRVQEKKRASMSAFVIANYDIVVLKIGGKEGFEPRLLPPHASALAICATSSCSHLLAVLPLPALQKEG